MHCINNQISGRSVKIYHIWDVYPLFFHQNNFNWITSGKKKDCGMQKEQMHKKILPKLLMRRKNVLSHKSQKRLRDINHAHGVQWEPFAQQNNLCKEELYRLNRRRIGWSAISKPQVVVDNNTVRRSQITAALWRSPVLSQHLWDADFFFKSSIAATASRKRADYGLICHCCHLSPFPNLWPLS